MDNLQGIYDKVATHLLTQNARSMLSDDHVMYNEANDSNCAYWDRDDGLKCAVGSLIPEDRYDPDIEGKSVSWVNMTCDMGWSTAECALLTDLQIIHDDRPVRKWKSELVDLALNCGLVPISL